MAGEQPPQSQQQQQQQQQQGSAVRGASLLIILQVASRAITFVANQLLLRFLTAQLLGVSTQLEVYYLSVLFFARESLRVAIQRQGSSSSSSGSGSGSGSVSGSSSTSSTDAKEEKHYDGDSAGTAASTVARDSQSVVNIAHLSLALGLGAAIGLGAMYLHYVDAATAATPHLETALRIYAAAAVVELLSEPAFVVLQHRLRFGPRAVAEASATLLRCAATFGAAGWAWKRGLDLGVLPFAVGQLAYGFGLLGVYFWYGFGLASSEGFSLLPHRRSSATVSPGKKAELELELEPEPEPGPDGNDYVLGYFYKPTLDLASSLTAQSFVKHILTQGDTFLVSILSDPRSQGIYALANNYGGLLARLIFQPIEESSRNYFSKLLSTSTTSTIPKTPKGSVSQQQQQQQQQHQNAKPRPDTQSVSTARDNLRALLRFYILLSILVVSIGPHAAPLLVQVVAGARWSASGAGGVLARYCLYVPLLAINGVAEAFVSSVATEAQVRRQSVWMSAFSLAFGAAGFIFLRVLDLGAAGLVYANAINMLCRILWSGAFISEYFRENFGVDGGGEEDFGWGSVVPNGAAIYAASTAALWAVLNKVGISVGGVSAHVFKDLITVAVCAAPYVALV